jgi:hypothetical protein
VVGQWGAWVDWGEPVSLPVLREGVDTLAELIAASGVAGAPTIAVEATGRLHQA